MSMGPQRIKRSHKEAFGDADDGDGNNIAFDESVMQSRFVALPGEIRNLIYKYCTADKEVIQYVRDRPKSRVANFLTRSLLNFRKRIGYPRWSRSGFAGLTQVSHQIRSEFMSLYIPSVKLEIERGDLPKFYEENLHAKSSLASPLWSMMNNITLCFPKELCILPDGLPANGVYNVTPLLRACYRIPNLCVNIVETKRATGKKNVRHDLDGLFEAAPGWSQDVKDILSGLSICPTIIDEDGNDLGTSVVYVELFPTREPAWAVARSWSVQNFRSRNDRAGVDGHREPGCLYRELDHKEKE
ncbi:hypothetical protein P154DRAFT_568854 [Amniculicola lignicola CBS 123094]|uniref:F-box domain-containing protein n=1 Tax=Amniculicola lignicola CBS 123094 TaxID=1392246 RepID=A0A6A5X4Z8_9PLEO|nr:hypothetical protein P154DRAFT_568854 [Amniculicola lignicola CBS 123094]